MVTKKTSPFEAVRTIISSQPRLITMITKRRELLQPPPHTERRGVEPGRHDWAARRLGETVFDSGHGFRSAASRGP